MDAFFSSEQSVDGSTCAQLYVGKQSYFTQVYGMRSENQMPDTLQDIHLPMGSHG